MKFEDAVKLFVGIIIVLSIIMALLYLFLPFYP
ncbi:unnamed protein product, partial [marine sediment metagenome]